MDEASLSIRLLGQFALRSDDAAPLTLESRRAESLLAYLLLHPGVQPRPRVAHLLWPDSTGAQALTNLRHLLHQLRQTWPMLDRHLEVTSRTLRWRDDAAYRLDVAELERALSTGAWEQAVDTYGGDLLAGATDEWLEDRRARLRRGYLDAIEHLVAECERRGDLARAVQHAERLLGEEPLRERTYLTLMRLHDALGDRARAVRVYHECAATLEAELGVAPAATTRAAYDALLARDEPSGVPEQVRLGSTPFVGRLSERNMLAAQWRQIGDGEARMVLLAGEAGIGKTRLAEEFRAWCSHRGATAALARAYPSEGALAYGPVATWLRSEGLAPTLRRLDPLHLTELARVLPELPGVVPGVSLPERLPESEQRARLYDAVLRALTALGRRLVLVADDVQWWDRESLRLLHYLLRSRPSAPMLVVATARREELDSGGPATDVVTALRAGGMLTEIELSRLDRAQTAALAERLSRTALSDRETTALHEQTAGNPLFVVETVRAGWRMGSRTMPPRVQAVIELRLAQLSEASRRVVDVAATVGAAFDAELLARASELGEETVVGALDELWRRRVIEENDHAGYDFSHDMIREVAYAGLSPVRRRRLHRSVAQALSDLHDGDPAALGGRLAHHLEQAGAIEQAITAYARAADVAQQVYAHSEAVRLISRALALLDGLPRTVDRLRHDLELSNALLAPLVAAEGYASARIHEAHRRALAITSELGLEPAPPLLRSLGLGRLARGDFAGARDCGRALWERGERDDDDVLRVEGDYLLGVAAFWAGDLVEATVHLERAVSTYRDENRREHLQHYAQDPKAICQTRLALAYWLLGDREAAIRARDRGLDVAEATGHPYTRSVCLLFAALLAMDMREPTWLRTYVDRAKGLLPLAAAAQVEDAVLALDALLDVLNTGSAEGVAAVRRIVADAPPEEQAAPGLRSTLLRILLAACEAAGDDDIGLEAAEELLSLTSSAIWRPEAERFRARVAAKQRTANA